MKRCARCGRELKKRTRFCENCGIRISEEDFSEDGLCENCRYEEEEETDDILFIDHI